MFSTAWVRPSMGIRSRPPEKNVIFCQNRGTEHDRRMIDGRFGDDRRLGKTGYAPVWGLDRDLLKKRNFFAKIVEMSMIEG